MCNVHTDYTDIHRSLTSSWWLCRRIWSAMGKNPRLHLRVQSGVLPHAAVLTILCSDLGQEWPLVRRLCRDLLMAPVISVVHGYHWMAGMLYCLSLLNSVAALQQHPLQQSIMSVRHFQDLLLHVSVLFSTVLGQVLGLCDTLLGHVSHQLLVFFLHQ